MVWKVRAIIMSLVICAILGTSQAAFAATHSIYDSGAISSTYVTYFKDTISGIGFDENYIAFRSGQNEYILIVGDLTLNNNTVSANGKCKQYRYYNEGTNYSSQTRYEVIELNAFSLDLGNYILYTDLGDYPELIERGAKYEMLSVLILSVIGLCSIIRRIFFKR